MAENQTTLGIEFETFENQVSEALIRVRLRNNGSLGEFYESAFQAVKEREVAEPENLDRNVFARLKS